MRFCLRCRFVPVLRFRTRLNRNRHSTSRLSKPTSAICYWSIRESTINVDDPKAVANCRLHGSRRPHDVPRPPRRTKCSTFPKTASRSCRASSTTSTTIPSRRTSTSSRPICQPSIGTPGAPVVMVEFSDFECPALQGGSEDAARQHRADTYPTQVRLYFKDFPLEQMHPWAKRGAIAGPLRFPPESTGFLGLSRLDLRAPGRRSRPRT